MGSWMGKLAAHAHSVPRAGHTRNSGRYLESLADSRVQHRPVHPAIHADRPHKEVVLLGLLLTNSSIYFEAVVSRLRGGGPRGRGAAVLTSLKTRRSATQTTTLTRWSSL